MMSSAVNGSPSDHFMPSRSLNVNSDDSSLVVQLSATFGMTSEKSAFQRVSPCGPTKRRNEL